MSVNSSRLHATPPIVPAALPIIAVVFIAFLVDGQVVDWMEKVTDDQYRK